MPPRILYETLAALLVRRAVHRASGGTASLLGYYYQLSIDYRISQTARELAGEDLREEDSGVSGPRSPVPRAQQDE